MLLFTKNDARMRIESAYNGWQHIAAVLLQGQLVAKNIQALVAGKALKAWKPSGGFPVRP